LDSGTIVAIHDTKRIKRLFINLLFSQEVITPGLEAKVNRQFQISRITDPAVTEHTGWITDNVHGLNTSLYIITGITRM
jgi:hypothetical protein